MSHTGGLFFAALATMVIAGSSACGGTAGPVVATIPAPVDSAPPAPAQTTPAAGPAQLLDSALIASLPAAEREAWMRYITASRAKRAAERAAMDAEVRAAGRERMMRAPYIRQAFEVTGRMTAEWFRSDSGRRMAESVLSYQTPSGGWSKHVNFAAGPRGQGQSYYSESDGWSYIGTIDNGSTTNQLIFLSAANAAAPDERYQA